MAIDEHGDPTEDEHHAIFCCSGYTDAREQYHNLFQVYITSDGHALALPHCNRLAKYLTWIRLLCMDRAWHDGLVPGVIETFEPPISQALL